jgi:hypothetical protein
MKKPKNKFEEYLNANKGIKFTIILGSGFHKINQQKTILSSWDELFKKMVPNFVSSGNYLLDFEKMILNHPTSEKASDVEKQKLSFLKNQLKDEQNKLSNEVLKQYPFQIFNPNFVSDIIILNFDTVAEKLCKEIHKCKISAVKYVEIDKTKKKDAKIHQLTRYTNVVFPNKEVIRCWHPHGSISKSEGIILSARNYATNIANIERLRKHTKSSELKNNDCNTWYNQLSNQPVLILGASISDTEWDLWSAFVNRERNFSKIENKKYYTPIFQMRSSEEKKSYCSTNNKIWFQELFNENLSFEKQWKELITIFSSKR